MKRPAFQFYSADWSGNAKLRRCNKAEKGAWIDTLVLMHDSDEYGVLRWPLKEISEAIGGSGNLKLLRGLADKLVMKGADAGKRIDPFIYTPRHAGKDGEPVVLIPAQDGPIWYSSRMVRDEYIRSKRGESTRFGDTIGGAPKDSPKPPIGDGSTASSSSSSSGQGQGPDGPPDCPQEKIIALYHELLPECPRVLDWNDARRGQLRQRWRDKAKPNGVTQGYTTAEGGIEWWRKFLTYVSESRFLTGKADPRPGREPFVADLEWITKSANFTHIIEGKYHR